MCGRYTVVSKVSTIEKRFQVKNSENSGTTPMVNISIGMRAPVITSDNPQSLQWLQFGLTPHWAAKNMYLFNARAEGDQNKDDSPDYHGKMGIIDKPAFRKSIRSKRCLIVADAFVEGPKSAGLDKPYLIFLRDKERPFAMAGIWDEWINQTTGEVIAGFSIITVAANNLLRMVGHPRCPVILEPESERTWLDQALPLTEVLALLSPPDDERMNGYPISAAIKSPKNQDISLLLPMGERLLPEWTLDISHELKLFGMGETNSRRKRNMPPSDGGQLDMFGS